MNRSEAITVAQFKAEAAKLQRLKVRSAAVVIVALFALLGVGLLFRELQVPNSEIYARALIALGIVPLLLIGFGRIDRLFQRFPKLMCRHCEDSLAASTAVVIATGNCPACGRKVLDDATIGS